MKSHSHPLLLLLSILLPISLLITPSQSCGINVYWGQGSEEGSLQDACASRFYKYVTVSFLTTFGKGQSPVLNLATHCGPPPATTQCTALANEIRFCQSQGIKVLLSLGGTTGSYGLSSPADARAVAGYLWNTYLSGVSAGPLGDVALDGIDFHLEYPSSTLYWNDLAKALDDYSTSQKKIILSAAPYCAHPDPNLQAAIDTGLFDYIWVKFYDNPDCDYSGGASRLLQSWEAWSSALPLKSQLLLGLPASSSLDAAGSGFIDYMSLVSKILPTVRNSKNYGGVMLWNKLYDANNSYSGSISSEVCKGKESHQHDLLISQVV